MQTQTLGEALGEVLAGKGRCAGRGCVINITPRREGARGNLWRKKWRFRLYVKRKGDLSGRACGADPNISGSC
jgi:hypothetical protein